MSDNEMVCCPQGWGVASCLAADLGMKQPNYIVDYGYREDN